MIVKIKRQTQKNLHIWILFVSFANHFLLIIHLTDTVFDQIGAKS